ncbi:hypothetical protein NDU88_007163 [Pleurodeles waltl]|uniref:Uncharacterized protein n=1 Tax=Pleurodeles waltl TaxID=8319 RepID=A0AAV7NSF1_PLEWA|nr:hypothetical protein NDU88_007163 [Pleurodeles waltl]
MGQGGLQSVYASDVQKISPVGLAETVPTNQGRYDIERVDNSLLLRDLYQAKMILTFEEEARDTIWVTLGQFLQFAKTARTTRESWMDFLNIPPVSQMRHYWKWDMDGD